MAQIVEMPKLSDTMTEGGVASWLKKVGEQVDEGEALLEIETDKATMEYYSPYEGTLLKILVQEGETSALSAPIAVLGEQGESFDLDQLIKSSGAGGSAETPAVPAPAANGAATSMTPAPSTAPAATNASSKGGRVFASPLARKKAQANGIDIAALQGSGTNGRVIEKDVDAAIASGSAGSSAASASAPQQAAVGQGQSVDSSRVEQQPLTMMRKTIAKRLLAAKNEAPHFYLTRSINMDNALAWRKVVNAPFEKAAKAGKEAKGPDGTPLPKVSVNDIVLLACTKALQHHPYVNGSWQGDSIQLNKDVHMAFALALPEGLITPVIREAQSLGVRAIASQVKELAAKAKGGNIAPEDYAGGTFTVSNLGMFGIEEFTAIINPPQAAILAVGTGVKTPVVGDDGEIEVRTMMKVTLSCDHRVVDGAVGAQFLATLTDFLENPMNMLS